LQELTQQRKAIAQISQSFKAIYPNLTEEEMVNYSKQMQIYGEVDAEKWVIRQHPPGNP